MGELKFSHEKTLSLNKTQLKNCERNLWKKQRAVGRRADERTAHYNLLQPKIEVVFHKDYSKAQRKTVAIWHGLRLDTVPLNNFLHSFSRHPDGLCECKKEKETVEHFVMSCPQHKVPRAKLMREVKKSFNTRSKPTLGRLLSCDNRSFKAMSVFLEDVTRFQPP